ncbi:MAG: hypothetical protein AAF706_03570 [Bacteroidota bacterium]
MRCTTLSPYNHHTLVQLQHPFGLVNGYMALFFEKYNLPRGYQWTLLAHLHPEYSFQSGLKVLSLLLALAACTRPLFFEKYNTGEQASIQKNARKTPRGLGNRTSRVLQIHERHGGVEMIAKPDAVRWLIFTLQHPIPHYC